MSHNNHAFIFRVGLWSRITLLATVMMIFSAVRFVEASPQPSPPPMNEPSDEIQRGIEEKIEPIAEQARPFFYRYSASISPRLGVGVMPDAYPFYSAGIAYMLSKDTNPRDEFALDFISTGNGLVQYQKKWITDATSRVRTFTKAGLDLYLVPEDGVGNLLSLSHYHARGGIGFERSIVDSMSFRADLELAIGVRDYQAALIVGYSNGW